MTSNVEVAAKLIVIMKNMANALQMMNITFNYCIINCFTVKTFMASIH